MTRRVHRLLDEDSRRSFSRDQKRSRLLLDINADSDFRRLARVTAPELRASHKCCILRFTFTVWF